MNLIQALAQAAAPWQSLYSDNTLVATMVAFVHVGALLVGGGFALAADRMTLRAYGAAPERRAAHLEELHATHRPVLIALALVAASGVLLFMADVETFATSPAFWIKMGLVALLLLNGLLLSRTEGALRGAPAEATHASSLWERLRATAWSSAALWLAIVLAGTFLVNA